MNLRLIFLFSISNTTIIQQEEKQMFTSCLEFLFFDKFQCIICGGRFKMNKVHAFCEFTRIKLYTVILKGILNRFKSA